MLNVDFLLLQTSMSYMYQSFTALLIRPRYLQHLLEVRTVWESCGDLFMFYGKTITFFTVGVWHANLNLNVDCCKFGWSKPNYFCWKYIFMVIKPWTITQKIIRQSEKLSFQLNSFLDFVSINPLIEDKKIVFSFVMYLNHTFIKVIPNNLPP